MKHGINSALKGRDRTGKEFTRLYATNAVQAFFACACSVHIAPLQGFGCMRSHTQGSQFLLTLGWYMAPFQGFKNPLSTQCSGVTKKSALL